MMDSLISVDKGILMLVQNYVQNDMLTNQLFYHRFVLRQNEGRRRMSSVKISRRPRSMERQRTAFTKSESGA